MLKRLLVLLLLLPVMVGANDLSVVYEDFIGSDTDGTRVDTVYTTSMDIRGINRIWITLQFEGLGDTVFANDSFFVGFQYSNDRLTWYSHATGDSLQGGVLKGAADTTINISTGIARDSIFCGNYGRLRILHRNALSSQQALTANTYTKRISAWFNTVAD